ncbi:helix-turn-helix domain-containing protein [Rhodococcus sp. IEGM 1330]|uniref:TetR/AcrR family transcriptional regulator n=1 Tax=Rhodococcus sp. IEGM 1330 TaxID=3082225 RepID=UPI002953FD91|nr:helix-turn-helix domain-containing protein [Rhodococcus sp. IEGM 1330]MDV8020089.1 helix-turn-helix domain-containing protein [Rhodococcus sp. IEGM 1330]
MPRQSKEEIDAEIVDRASALFARHGYQHTSLQQVADAAGYSKAGLLHRFSTKEAIYLAAVHSALGRMNALVEEIAEIPAGAERTRAVFEALVDATTQWPGTAAFLQTVVNDNPADAAPELVQAGAALVAALGSSPEGMSDDALVRLISATAGLQAAASTAARRDRARQWRPLIVAAAMDAIGPARLDGPANAD